VCGILPIEDASTDPRGISEHTWWREEQTRKITETGCENLRLVWSNYEQKSVPGFPHAEICCKRRQGQCVCNRALESGVAVQNAIEPTPQSDQTLMEVFAEEDGEIENITPAPQAIKSPVPLTADQLKQIDREVRTRKRQNLEECKAMREEMIRLTFQGLTLQNLEMIRWIMRELVTYTKRDKLVDAPVEELWLAIAEHLVSRLFDWSYSEPSPERTLKTYNEILQRAGMDLIQNVAAATEERN